MRIEDVEIDWTWASIEHIARHGVDPEEVEECIYEDAPMVLRKGRDRYLVLCQCLSGRYLFIVLTTPDRERRVRVITARDMTERERRYYRGR